MKLNKLTIAVAAVILVAVYFCMNRLTQSPGRDNSILENAPAQESESRAGDTPDARQTQQASDAHGTRNDVAAALPQGKVRIRIGLPKPTFGGTPREIKGANNLEPPRDGKPYPPIIVPEGCGTLLSLECKVTSSDPDPILGELSYITDGEKEWDSAAYVELAPGTQWVQIDLGQEREIHGVCVWHNFYEPRVYRDVVCQVSNDPDFIDDIVTVFNNDHDNSSKLGVGKDKEYIETNEGRPFPVNAVKGRYVRFYSRGNTANEMNHYIEIEIYGR